MKTIDYQWWLTRIRKTHWFCMATKKIANPQEAKTRPVSVTFDISLWQEVERWIENREKRGSKTSNSAGVCELTRRGLDAITLPDDLIEALDRRRADVVPPMSITRDQVLEGLVRLALGTPASPQGDLGFGREASVKR